MPYRVVKQLHPAPSGSGDQLWEFSTEASASTKMTELRDADSSGRLYKVIEV